MRFSAKVNRSELTKLTKLEKKLTDFFFQQFYLSTAESHAYPPQLSGFIALVLLDQRCHFLVPLESEQV